MSVSTIRGLPLAEFAKLNGIERDNLRSQIYRGHIRLPSFADDGKRQAHARRRFQFADALAIAIANGLSEDGGMPFPEAMRTVAEGRAVQQYFEYRHKFEPTDQRPLDYWFGIGRWRVTETDESGSQALSTVREFWSTGAIYAGPLLTLVNKAEAESAAIMQSNSGSEFMRLAIVDVSAADRQLRRKAKAMGFRVADDKFVGNYG